MNEGESPTGYFPPPQGGREYWTPVLMPASQADACWAVIGATSEFEVARAIVRLVREAGLAAPGRPPLPVVVTMEPSDIAALRPRLDQFAERLAGIVAARTSGCRVQVELRAGSGKWSVALGPAKRAQPRTKVVTELGHHNPTVYNGQPGTARLCLVVSPGHRRILVPDTGLVLGRAVSTDGLLNDRNVSREHCRVDHGPGFLVVEDLHSRNGTWVSGARITIPTQLGVDDQLRIGRIELWVTSTGTGRE